MKTKEESFSGMKLAGIPMLIFNFAFLVAIVVFLVWVANQNMSVVPLTISIVGAAVLFIVNCIVWGGFMQIEPNEARVMIFFG